MKSEKLDTKVLVLYFAVALILALRVKEEISCTLRPTVLLVLSKKTLYMFSKGMQ